MAHMRNKGLSYAKVAAVTGKGSIEVKRPSIESARRMADQSSLFVDRRGLLVQAKLRIPFLKGAENCGTPSRSRARHINSLAMVGLRANVRRDQPIPSWC